MYRVPKSWSVERRSHEPVINPAVRAVGILMLDTSFPRPVGDVGNPNTHRFPCLFERVPGAMARAVVGPDSVREIDRRATVFEAAARRLIQRGAVLIGTSCGFLAPLQSHLQQRLTVPIALSALPQVRMLEPIYGAGRIGIITFDAATLSRQHLDAAGIETDVPVVGLAADSCLRQAILHNHASIDHDAARRELAALARHMKRRHPQLAAIVLECTNLPPYRDVISQASGLAIYDVNTMLDWLWSGLERRTHRGR